MGQLIEINFNVDVRFNSPPDFVVKPETTFVLAVGDVLTYLLPPVVDPEGNDTPLVFITTTVTHEDGFPPFLTFDNSTSSLIFENITAAYEGKTFYFDLITKEANSESMMVNYNCSIQIIPRPVQDIKYSITNLRQSKVLGPVEGSIIFSHDIDMDWLSQEGRFFDMFDIYYFKGRYSPLEQFTMPKHFVEEFRVTENGNDDKTILFQAYFERGQAINGELFIKVKDGFDI